jgi:16S rRNA (cytosine967-C5)-methyltransferase
LSRLLGHTADAVQAVRAGQSLNEALARCPATARPGTQALSFQVLRRLGSATAVRTRLAPKTPQPAVDALVLSALALLWPEPEAARAADPGEATARSEIDVSLMSYAPHTLVDQAVEAARQRHAASAGFVNAVLRRFLRERAVLQASLANDEVAQFNHPGWWIERLRNDWPAQWRSILAANNRRAPMTLRVNLQHGSVEHYLERLAGAGLAAHALPLPGPASLFSAAVVLAHPVPVQVLPGFDQGDVSVQDAGAQTAVALMLADAPGLAPLAPGARVLDACAAPGGKTAQWLEQSPVPLDLWALDRDPQRLLRVDESLARLGLRARTVAADAGVVSSWWDGQAFDAILLDAPCSASGIVRRHPDVRWLRRPSDIGTLAQTQAALLDALWPLLKPGGRLVYCTCSVFKAEGQHQIDAFLQRQTRASPVAAPASPGHLLPLADNSSTGSVAAGSAHDGFFHALLTHR